MPTIESPEEMYRRFADMTQSTVRLNPALVELGFMCGVVAATRNLSPFLRPLPSVSEHLKSSIETVPNKIYELSVKAAAHEMRRMSAEDVKRIEESIRQGLAEIKAAAACGQATAPGAPKEGVTGDGSV